MTRPLVTQHAPRTWVPQRRVTSRPRVGTGILRIRALAHLCAAVDRSKAEPDPPLDRPSVPDAPAGSTQKGVASETPEKPRFDIAHAMANRERACERVRHLTRHLGATDPSDERDVVERNPTAAGENPAHIPPRADRVKKRAKGRFFPAGSPTLKSPHTPPSRLSRAIPRPSTRRGPEDPARPRRRRRNPHRHRQPHRQALRGARHRGRLRLRHRLQGHQGWRRRQRAQAVRPGVHEHRPVQEQDIVHRRRQGHPEVPRVPHRGARRALNLPRGQSRSTRTQPTRTPVNPHSLASRGTANDDRGTTDPR